MEMPQVGKRYRLNVKKNPEYRCCNCGRLGGSGLLEETPELQGSISEVWGSPEIVYCRGCSQVVPAPEGLYTFGKPDRNGEFWSVPYTWLEPLEEEDAPCNA